MKGCKEYLKKNIFLYRMFQRAYYGLRWFFERYVLGTGIQEWLWRRAYRSGDAGHAAETTEPHQRILMEKIADHRSFQHILEIGCGHGANLLAVARRFPAARIAGLDINDRAIEQARRYLADRGINSDELWTGKADHLERLADKSFDLVFTSAVLIYIAPDKIDAVIRQVLRVASRAIILNEWHFASLEASGKETSFYCYGHWVHDYARLFSRYLAPERIRVTKIPEAICRDEQWARFGTVIEVSLEGGV